MHCEHDYYTFKVNFWLKIVNIKVTVLFSYHLSVIMMNITVLCCVSAVTCQNVTVKIK